MLFSIIFTVNIGVCAYFAYSRWYLKKDVTHVKFGTRTQKKIELKNRTYYFYSDMINLNIFESNLLKTDKNHYKGINIYYIG